MRQRTGQTYQDIEITETENGKGLTYINEIPVYVTGCVPGDIADIKIIRRNRRSREAVVTEFKKYSSQRALPACEHFGVCGGCVWQNIPYSVQLFYKQKQVKDAFKQECPEVDFKINDIIGSDNIFFYRNKLEFTFSAQRWLTADELNLPDQEKQLCGLGFHIPGKFDKVLDIEKCHLQSDPSNAIRLAAKKFAIDNKLSFFNIRFQEGFLRNMIVRTASTGEIMVCVVFGSDDKEPREKLLDFLYEKFPEITSLMFFINTKRNDDYSDLEAILYKGKNFITEKMENLQFKIQAKSFYQTNSLQAYKLYSIARDFADIKDDEIVYDLYTGTGTIANFISSKCKKVVGIEYIEEAIQDAKENSRLNGINNTVFYAGDMKDVLNEEFININGKPQVMIIDPPRAGMHPDVVKTVINAAPEKIVYVSCNPKSQAHDIAMMKDYYQIAECQPVDMFPQTHHVENVILLKKIQQ